MRLHFFFTSIYNNPCLNAVVDIQYMGTCRKGKKNLRLPPPILLVVEMFESTPLFKFHLHRKDIGENLTSDSGAG